MSYNINSDFLEKLIVKAMLRDKQYLVLITSTFEPDYFESNSVSSIFSVLKNQMDSIGTIPSKDIIINSVGDLKNEVRETLQESDEIEFDLNDQKYLLEVTNEYLKEQAIKKAIIESVNIIDAKGEKENIRKKIEDALCKDLSINLGLKYFQDLGNRLRRIFTASTIKIPTFFNQLDEFINGGFPPFTLSFFIAKIHGWKSNMISNIAGRQVLKGYNPVIMTLEMSEDAYSQRIDALFSKLDINKMYLESNHRGLIEKLSEVKSLNDRGELYIKQFPTGAATIRDFRLYLRELTIRDIKPSILLVDYVNLMKSLDGTTDLYGKVKGISEDLRALSFEFEVPVVSVSQLNREGSFVGFEELNYSYIAESLGLAATADFLAIFGTNEDDLVYESEVHYKIVKNRLGGRVGEYGKLYYDSRNLRMYDEMELDLWINEAAISGDERNLAQIRNQHENNTRRRRR